MSEQSTKTKRPARISWVVKPQDMSLVEWQRALRRQVAQEENMECSEPDAEHLPGEYQVTNAAKSQTYKVVYRGEDCGWNYCSCMDFKTSQLGTCKHIESVKRVLEQEHRRPHVFAPAYTSVYLSYRDSLLRADVTEAEQFNVSGSRRTLPIEALSFFTPVKGVVSRGFDLTVHPWADITAPAGTPVLAVLDGTVVYTGWDAESGYILAIQHKGEILSIYKNNQKVLRQRGDVVKGGTPVGMVASSSSLTAGDHLHFELWYDGKPVDPALYISF